MVLNFVFNWLVFPSYQVCATVHERRGEHKQVLKCYLLDNSRKHRVFNYIEQSPHKEELQSAVLENIDVSLKPLTFPLNAIFGGTLSSLKTWVSLFVKNPWNKTGNPIIFAVAYNILTICFPQSPVTTEIRQINIFSPRIIQLQTTQPRFLAIR